MVFRTGLPMRPADKSPTFLDALKVPNAAFAPGAAVTYTVLESRSSDTPDKRFEPRRRTRLRSGKVLDTKNNFLVECQVHDRSPRGARLRLVANVFAPARLRLFDDEAETLRDARVVWRRAQEIGIRFLPQGGVENLSPAKRAALSGRYYAMKNETTRA